MKLGDHCYMKVGPVLILVLFICSIAQSQTRHGQSGASAASSLTITATVAPSVWLVMEPDAAQKVVVANVPDPKESFSHAATKARRNYGSFRFPNGLKPVRRNQNNDKS